MLIKKLSGLAVHHSKSWANFPEKYTGTGTLLNKTLEKVKNFPKNELVYPKKVYKGKDNIRKQFFQGEQTHVLRLPNSEKLHGSSEFDPNDPNPQHWQVATRINAFFEIIFRSNKNH